MFSVLESWKGTYKSPGLKYFLGRITESGLGSGVMGQGAEPGWGLAPAPSALSKASGGLETHIVATVSGLECCRVLLPSSSHS